MHAFDFGTSTIVSMMVRPGFSMFSTNKGDLAKLQAMRQRAK
jgi:hypothetical protein